MKVLLVPIDCSDATSLVLAMARQMASAFSAEIHLVHVREIASRPVVPLEYGGLGMPEMVPMSGMSVPMPGGPPANVVTDGETKKSQLSSWQQELADAGLRVTVHEPEGEVIDEILKLAESTHADAIVMGRHGHGAMYNLLVGSITEGVLKRSGLPMLLVPTAEPGQPG